MSHGHTVLPFSKLSWPKFEALLFEILASGLTIELPASKNPRRAARRYRVVRADPYGGEGHKQKGIDFLCTMDDGSDWVFQAKLTSEFGLTKAKAAVNKARRKFPKAKRYILLVSCVPNPTAFDYVRKQANWEIWGGPSITAHFLRGLPIQRQIEIIGRIWPAQAAALVADYYPLRDRVLTTPEEFFSLWVKPDRLFHHRSRLVGHADTLDQLSAFLSDPIQRVAILVAPGGCGKSRLLRAFAERTGQERPDFTVRFVDPHAPPSDQAHSLRTTADTHFVVVQDDAHRYETLRRDLIANLAATKGKLLLATRPQAIDYLQELVVQLGIPANQVRKPINLPKLTLREHEALALAELDPKHREHSTFLARMGADCPLIITVGAALINRNEIPPDKFEERNFRAEVFARFEGDELNRLDQVHPRQLVREVLQTIAVFSPWLENEVSSVTVAGFIGCSERDLQAVITSLEAGQLIVQSGSGRRVIPDLFSDHLVYTACYTDEGVLTPYSQRLADAFADSASQNMLRNIAEADWRARQYHTAKPPASLLDPFWESLWKLYSRSDFHTRAQIIEKWGKHSVYQPERSLQLCELAIHLQDAPPPPQSQRLKGETGSRITSYQYVLDRIPLALEPIAIFIDEYRERTLDLLLDLAAVWPPDRGLKDNNHPWAIIGRIASFKADHPITASKGVLAWIEKRIQDPRFLPALASPNGILDKILSPVFARQFDASFSEGNTFTFRHPPVSISQTQPMRDQALKIIERQILPLGEIPTLNVLPVLDAASQTFYNAIGGRFDEHTMRRWQPERLRALAIMDRIAQNASGHVCWQIRTHVRHLFRSEHPKSKLHRQAADSLKRLPFTGPLRETAVFCSHAWQEFDDELFSGPKRSTEESKADVNQNWLDANDAVAMDLMARYVTGAALLVALEGIYLNCQRVGFNPNPFTLFNSIGRINPKVGKSVVDQIAKRKDAPLRYWWPNFIAATLRFPDTWLERTCYSVLRSDSPPAVLALLNFLTPAVAGSVPASILKAVSLWAKSARDQMANVAIQFTRYGRDTDDPVWLAVAPHLDLRRLTSEQLIATGVSVHDAVKFSKVNAPEDFLLDLVAAMTRVRDLKFDRGHDFLSLMGERFPRAVFDLYQRRILLSEEKKIHAFNAVPMDPHPLKGLPSTIGYAQLVRSLFRTIRARRRTKRWAWNRLLQSSVIAVSPLALPELLAWVRSARSVDELESIGSLLAFNGSVYLLQHPDLTLALIRRGRALDPVALPQLEARLASTVGPKIHSFTNNKRDPEQEYVTAEVKKLQAAGNVPPELQSFYAAVLKHEQSWAVRGGGAVFDND